MNAKERDGCGETTHDGDGCGETTVVCGDCSNGCDDGSNGCGNGHARRRGWMWGKWLDFM